MTSTTEYLLADTKEVEAHMVSNKHMIPFITISPGVLQVRLVPRKVAGTLSLASVGSLGFRLGNCRIAEVQHPTRVNVVGEPSPVERGLCVFKMTESYIMPDGSAAEAVSTWDVLKRTGGDMEFGGGPV
jgi:hypothetical protein